MSDYRETEEFQMEIEGIYEAIEAEGLGYALFGGGYITPNSTDDPELKEAIEMALKGCKKIMSIVNQYS